MTPIHMVQKSDFSSLIELWESSVKATHHFLTEQIIDDLKVLLLNSYFPIVTLFCSYDKDEQYITGFAGVNDSKLEMLFISPKLRGRGIGKALLTHAIKKFNITSVDVNEQNPQAIGFYQSQGFKIIGRSPTDGQGQPYPLLHLAYKP